MKIRFSVLALICFFWSMTVVASIDPVAWSLSPSTGFPSTKVGDQSTVVYTLTNNIPNLTTTLVTEINTTGGNFNVLDGCNNTPLVVGQSCQISISFSPVSAGNSTFELIYEYNRNRIPLPALTAVGHN